MNTALDAFRTWSKRRLARLGILPDAAAQAAARADAGAAGPSWLWLCVGAWAVMMGALMASAPLIASPVFVLKVGAALVLAFPVAYYLHFSRVSRRWVNWLVLLAAVALGVLEVKLAWPADGLRSMYGTTPSFAVLVKAFLWVMAFRAFALRSLSDLVLSVIPAVSCIILVLVGMPTPAAVAGTALVAVGALYLLAAERSVEAGREADAPAAVRRVAWERGPRRGAAINTWQSVSVAVLLVALLAGGGVSYLGVSSDIGRAARDLLALHLAGYLIGERRSYAPEPVLYLTGAAPPQGDRVIFVVECERGDNWRQQSYARYTGNAWHKFRGPRRRAARPEGDLWLPDLALVSGFRPQGATMVRQVFRVHAPVSSVLPGLFLATSVRAPVMNIHTGEDGSLVCSGYVDAGRTYEVFSLVPAEGPTPRTDPLPPLDEATRETYLQLPDTLPERVRELARQETAGARDPYDAALTLREFLVSTYPYTLRPEPRPRGDDFVDHFLFETRRGFCNHYASAMVVMCRAVGIPARFVTGFVAGEYEPETDSYEVRDKDAHSWAEVYIEGRGWQSLDPTPPLEEERERRNLAALLNRAADALAEALLAAGVLAARHRAPAAVAFAGLLTLAAGVRAARRRAHRRVRLNGRGASPEQRARFAYEQMLRWLARVDAPRLDTQGALEHLSALPAWAAPLEADAARVTHCHLRARYGSGGVRSDEAAAAEEALARLRDMLLDDRLRAPQGSPRSPRPTGG